MFFKHACQYSHLRPLRTFLMHLPTLSYLAGVLAAVRLVGASRCRAPKPKPPGVPKLVVAHHIVGLTASYTIDEWATDISLAQSSGIDGFALNIGMDDYTSQQVENAFQAAGQLNSAFKLFLSFDMTSYHCASATDADPIRNLTLQYASHPSQLQVDGKAFVSSFSGETCTFGQGDVPGGWRTEFTQHPDVAGKIHFVPRSSSTPPPSASTLAFWTATSTGTRRGRSRSRRTLRLACYPA